MITNLTPHVLSLFNEAKELVATVAPSGAVARVTTSRVLVGDEAGIPLYSTEYGEVTGLPEPADGVLYVVSGLVRAAVPNRTDVWQPGDLLRNESGQPVGAIGLSR